MNILNGLPHNVKFHSLREAVWHCELSLCSLNYLSLYSSCFQNFAKEEWLNLKDFDLDFESHHTLHITAAIKFKKHIIALFLITVRSLSHRPQKFGT